MTIALTILLVTFFVLVLIGVPIAFAMIGSVVLVLLIVPDISLDVAAAQMLNGINIWPLLAVPLFLLAGELMNRGGVTAPLVDAVQGVVGPIPGGLAHTAVVSNMVMAGMSGSDIADVTATSSVLMPALKRAGYPAPFSAALIAGAGAMGPLIPPSIGLILYGLVTNVSIPRLFMAGAVPGVVLGIALMILVLLASLRYRFPRERLLPPRTIGALWLRAAPAFSLPLVVLVGIVVGWFTPTEAAAVAALVSLLLGTMYYKQLRWSDVPAAFLSAAKTSASILFIVAAASMLGLVLTVYEVGPMLAHALVQIAPNAVVLLLIINIGLLFLGAIFETAPVIILIVPLMLGAVKAFDIDLAQFGVMVLFNTLIGLMIPPFGISMFIVCRIADISVWSYTRQMWPVLVTMLLVLVAITYVPPLSLALPNALHIR